MPQRIDRIRTLAAGSRFRVGPILVHPERLAIERDGAEISLEPRIMELLVALAEHAGEVIGAEQLLIEVWRGTFYGDNPVHRAIGVLRRQLGDDLRNPVFIETIRKRGYRLIAPVAFPEDYRRNPSQVDGWAGRNPYLGLAAYDAEHAAVFFGRSRLTAEVLGALRRQRETQRRFLLLVGASGCGKTSLLRASVLPLLEQAGGFDGMQALSTTHCDFAATPDGDPMQPLAAALATWQLDGRPVFAPQPVEALAERLTASPEHVTEALDDAWRRRTARNDSEHAHLLLLVDHAEALVASDRIDDTQRRRAWAVIDALCAHPRAGTLMVVRGDFHAALIAALPDIAERKGSDGHIDATPPRAGEIAQIVRMPAYLSGLSFEEDPNTGARLDDVLRDAAADKPDTLPLLQYTLHALYERRRDDGLLTFEAYRDIGGLEGAVAHRAEAVFAELPGDVRAQLDHVLAQLIVMHSDNDSVSARRVSRSTLANDAARALVDTFVKGRLFVGGQAIDSPNFGVAHEALLRQWPRAREWAQDNRRLLQAKARMQRAAARWVEEGRSADHLLNPGRPLQEAREAAGALPDDLSADERAFINASAHQYLRRRRLRMFGVVGLAVSAVISAVFGVVALQARDEAERRREESAQLTDFMLVELADKLRPLGKLSLLDSISAKALAQLERQSKHRMDASDLVNRARAFRAAGEVFMEEGKLKQAHVAFLHGEMSAINAAAKAPRSTAAIAELSNTAYWLGYNSYRQQKIDEAHKHWTDNLRYCEELVHLEPKNIAWKVKLSDALATYGVINYERGRSGESLALFKRAESILSMIISKTPNDDSLRFQHANTLSWISRIDLKEGRLQQTAFGLSEQVKILRSLLAKNPDARTWEFQLAINLLNSSHVALSMGLTEESHRMIKEGISILSKLTRFDERNLAWARDLARAHLQASEIERTRGRRNEMARHILIAERMILKNRISGDSTRALRILDATARLLNPGYRHDVISAEAQRIEALHVMEQNHDQFGSDTNTSIDLATALVTAAKQRLDAGLATQARSDLERAISVLKREAANSHDPTVLAPWTNAHLLLGRRQEIEYELAWLEAIDYKHPEFIKTLIDNKADATDSVFSASNKN